MSKPSKKHSIINFEKPQQAWNIQIKQAFRDPISLLEYLELATKNHIQKVDTDNTFQMLVPLSYAAKMTKGDWNDPLLRQVLPLKDEIVATSGFVSDPVGDLTAEVSPGVLHKYHGRILLVTTGACPVHCRYCFRRDYPYGDSTPDKKHWQSTLETIKQDPSIKEVILSGGDPLMLSDKRLQKLCSEIEAISHITTIRFHTRVPLFLPERITSELLNYFGDLKVNLVFVIHSNHANEIDENVANTLVALRGKGITLLNQSVLLKGVNDSVETLVELSQRLFSCQVLPYYIHQLDKVQGAAHFEVHRKKAFNIIESLKDQLPGYLVPKLVEEVAGKKSKKTILNV